MSQRLVVVVVDDEPDLRHLLTEILESEGFSVLALAHPSLALSFTSEDKPVLFLLDLMLPGMNGIELARRLRQGPHANVVLIGISASPAMLRAAADSKLFEETIAKPFELPELIDTLRQYAA